MEVFKNIFNDWVGIMSFGVISVTIVIAIYFLIFFLRKSAKQD